MSGAAPEVNDQSLEVHFQSRETTVKSAFKESFYTLPDTGYVRSGTTFEWTWNEVWPGEPGSRIVVLYYPWNGNPTRLELSVPM